MRLVAALAVAFAWLGPAALAAAFAYRVRDRRTVFTVAAVAAHLPLFALITWAVGTAAGHYDGECHHAPDISYPCSYPRYLIESFLPLGFGIFTYMLLAPVSLVWGVAVLLAAVLWARRPTSRR